MRKLKTYLLLVFALLLFFIFKNWFSPTLIAGGDWVYYYPSMVADTRLFTAWDDRSSGLGNNKVITLPLVEAYFESTMKLSQGVDWRWYERIFWFGPFLLFSITSSFFLTKKILKQTSFAFLGSFLYTTNTYALMLIGGGQNGVALAYSCLPFVVLTFLNLLETSDSLFFSLLFTASLNALAFFDFRILYVILPMLILLAILYLIKCFPQQKILKRFLYVLCLPALFTIGIGAFWILPLLFSRGTAVSQFGDVYTGAGAVKFFSFAFFENTLGLLHPNWPENIFGKVSFMRPEFMIYPLLAFGSLLFIKPLKSLRSFGEKRTNLYIVYFLVVGLVGIFLAKGANDPFGNVYLWMFDHLPGFFLFRDPTKWYMLICLSDSILIPFTVSEIVGSALERNKK